MVVDGAKLTCDQGMSPGSLTVLPVHLASGDDRPAATVDVDSWPREVEPASPRPWMALPASS